MSSLRRVVDRISRWDLPHGGIRPAMRDVVEVEGTSGPHGRVRFAPGEELAVQWEELAGRTEAPPFLRPGWVVAWHRAFRSGPFEVAVLDGPEGLRALVPLERRSFALITPVNWHTPVAGIVAVDEEAAHELCEALLASSRRSIQLGFVAAGSVDQRALRAGARRLGFRLTERPLVELVHRRLDGGWDEVERSLSSKLRSDVRRRRRRLAEVGHVAVEVVDDGDLDGMLSSAFAVEASGWKGERGTAMRSSPATEGFYREVARWAAGRGWLRLAFLRVGDRPIAFQYLLDAHGIRYYVKGGYDEEFRRYAPGKVLLHDVLRDAAGRGLSRFEFLGRREPYKDEWATGARELVEIRACPPGALGSLDLAVHARAAPIARRALAEARRRGWRLAGGRAGS